MWKVINPRGTSLRMDLQFSKAKFNPDTCVYIVFGSGIPVSIHVYILQ